ncbi:MAG: uroporphyrinogen-III synthase [Bacteroidales bacterium]|nr:uroporphyrinogen-III synthase [Bacteroidales bacterium]
MKLKKILISQPEPTDLEKSPYKNLSTKYGVELTFYKFFEVVGLSASEFRKSRIHLTDYTAIIFNSKNSVDHFFRLAKELRENIPDSMKYFCTSEAIALYLQNYIQYRKRKIFFGNQYFSELVELLGKHREEKFLFPCSDEKQTEYTKLLDKAKFKYTKATMYTSVPRDLTHFNLKDFDMICLFSPIGVRSLVQNFPDVATSGIMIAAFGASTHSALKAAGIKLTIAAPTKTAPSMAMAVENYINGKGQDDTVITRSSSIKKEIGHTRGTTTTVKKTKSVFANKAKYKQLQEERKAAAAARRAERLAAKAAKEAKEGKESKEGKPAKETTTRSRVKKEETK